MNRSKDNAQNTALRKDLPISVLQLRRAISTPSGLTPYARTNSAPACTRKGIAVYRKIAEQMPSFDTVLMHGSCVAVDGEGYLFSAKSGTGKSTHTRLWREVFGDRAVMINDDKPLIRIADGGAVIYGTPWNGKHHLGTNCGVPLRAICLLERAEQNCIRRITAAEAYPYLVQQIYRPADAAAMRKTVQLIDRLSGSVALWRLGCNMDPEAARVAYQAMKGPRP